MTKERQVLIDRFQKWLDTNPRKEIIAAQCATIAEEYHSEQLLIHSVVVPKGTFYCWDGAVGEQVCDKQCVDCNNENEGKLQQ